MSNLQETPLKNSIIPNTQKVAKGDKANHGWENTP